MSMKLWYSPASPFVRKVLVFAHETGVADSIELVPGNVWEPDTGITRDNPLGKVPALATPDGVFAGSYLCCEYLDTLHAGPRLIPQDGPERWPVLQLHAFADGIIEATVARVIEQVRRPKEYIYQGTLDRQSAKIVQTLDRIAPMTPTQIINIATITLGCALGYLDFRAPQLAWREGRGALSLWYETFSARKSMQATLPHV
ncbi:MAG: glutathione S-transferase N-terminal domain-containing protein [Burkholderiales bacterium]|nr:glutathione S-transferase N-terminal domain-containing protein [Burkholderiales bacterium]